MIESPTRITFLSSVHTSAILAISKVFPCLRLGCSGCSSNLQLLVFKKKKSTSLIEKLEAPNSIGLKLRGFFYIFKKIKEVKCIFFSGNERRNTINISIYVSGASYKSHARFKGILNELDLLNSWRQKRRVIMGFSHISNILLCLTCSRMLTFQDRLLK